MVRRLFEKAGLPFLLLTVACLVSEGQTGKFVVRTPRIIAQQVQPVFTPEALQARLIGNGTIDVTVDAVGVPAEIRLVSWSNLNSGGSERLGLDAAVVEAIRKWRFVPVLVDGKATPFDVRIGALLHPEGSTFSYFVK